VFWESLNHIEFVYLFCVVFRLRVILSTALLSVLSQFLYQFPRTIVKRQYLKWDLIWTQGLWWTGTSMLQIISHYALIEVPLSSIKPQERKLFSVRSNIAADRGVTHIYIKNKEVHFKLKEVSCQSVSLESGSRSCRLMLLQVMALFQLHSWWT
ncbi:hypothetical protein AALO_G00247910, partial [Alosa alosa]